MMRRLVCKLGNIPYWSDECGAAAAEFAIWLLILIPAILNVVDLAFYAYDKTQVANAAQAGVEAGYAAWANCSSATSTSGCNGFSTAVTNAISNSGYIGGSISQPTTGQSTEGYYCADLTTGKLTANGTSSSCSTGATAGYYYPLKVTFTYTPVFKGATITSLLNTTIAQESWIRLK
jgi:Flp pilus assembly protein TadG